MDGSSVHRPGSWLFADFRSQFPEPINIDFVGNLACLLRGDWSILVLAMRKTGEPSTKRDWDNVLHHENPVHSEHLGCTLAVIPRTARLFAVGLACWPWKGYIPSRAMIPVREAKAVRRSPHLTLFASKKGVWRCCCYPVALLSTRGSNCATVPRA